MRRLLASEEGLTAVEFALVAPAFLTFMMLIMDGARATWTYQTLQEVAVNSARCAALNRTGCTNDAEVKTYAVARATAASIKLVGDNVVRATGQNCNGMAGMTRITITAPYTGATTKMLPSTLTTLTTESCFPTSS